MRISVDHRTRYVFSEPQSRIVQLLRLWPDDSDSQTVVDWRIDVDCDARLRRHRDGLGNQVTMLYADGPIDAIEISVQGEVLTSMRDGHVSGVIETLPAAFYARDTPATRADAAIAAFAREHGDPLAIAGALGVMARPADGSGETLRDAAEAFAAGDPSVREAAQVMIAAMRSLGTPARYVSGYLLGEENHGAPHGWVEIASRAGAGWIAIDPSRGGTADERHVRMCVGLDAHDAAPVAGSRLGAGSEALDVDLHVARGSRQE
ncbi:transglutaminase family protein [Sphingomonas baiyangensis]|uniref:Transglutaminase family protein n=1 Tax=Sphingomonas baiyangensis TaxID=2572576 RepID=A0A4U1L2W6_9SPHN|nr:transglutaminase family protein [Sphingomonas baiyangensis]TKD51237.1 transglutaminase family protein [Sphingomonas baiyangensis]